MSVTIRNNIVAVASANSVNRAHDALERTTGRITSGNRIHRVGDDAAGSAVSVNLRAQGNSTRAAIRNINDAIAINHASTVFVKDSQDLLVRMRELAVQSASDTIEDTERSYIDSEYDELADEMKRFVVAASFNGIKISSGTTLTIQVGTGTLTSKDEIDITMGNVRSVHTVVADQDLSNATDAQTALTHFDNSMTKLNLMQSTLGGQHNRLTSALHNAQETAMSIDAAGSRIIDTDYATETATMTAHQVKLQASAAALSQANGLSRNVINLI